MLAAYLEGSLRPRQVVGNARCLIAVPAIAAGVRAVNDRQNRLERVHRAVNATLANKGGEPVVVLDQPRSRQRRSHRVLKTRKEERQGHQNSRWDYRCRTKRGEKEGKGEGGGAPRNGQM